MWQLLTLLYILGITWVLSGIAETLKQDRLSCYALLGLVLSFSFFVFFHRCRPWEDSKSSDIVFPHQGCNLLLANFQAISQCLKFFVGATDKEYSGIKTRVEMKISLTSVQEDVVIHAEGFCREVLVLAWKLLSSSTLVMVQRWWKHFNVSFVQLWMTRTLFYFFAERVFKSV